MTEEKRRRINGERLGEMIQRLGEIGYIPGEGTSRMAYSENFYHGRDYVQRCMEEAGMETQIDPVGNLTGRIRGETEQILSIGSHIDTVPGGGMYDGALGVLAGIEAVRTLKESGCRFWHTLEVIAFNEEEGNVVGGTFGSKAFAGQPQEEAALERMREQHISRADLERSKRNPDRYDCYLEYHIEQGGILENAQTEIGIVQGIVGIARYWVTVQGEANHAGSTPMYLRRDALVKSCEMITDLIAIAGGIDPEMTCTIGKMEIQPGAVNVIPGKVIFPVELRCMDTGKISRVMERFSAAFPDAAVENFLWQEATPMDRQLAGIFRECGEKRGLSHRDMPSGAGHDAINMGLFTRTAMIFIPSVGGISHSEKEYSRHEDVVNGAEVLMDAILAADQQIRKENVQ